MHRPLSIAAALSACLLLGGFSPGVQPRVASSVVAPSLASTLATETHRRLSAEFASQDVQFELGGTRVWQAGDALLRVRAEGTADFGADGHATTTIDAVYDRQAGRWLKLDYQQL